MIPGEFEGRRFFDPIEGQNDMAVRLGEAEPEDGEAPWLQLGLIDRRRTETVHVPDHYRAELTLNAARTLRDELDWFLAELGEETI